MVLSMKTTSEDCVMVGVFCNASTLPITLYLLKHITVLRWDWRI